MSEGVKKTAVSTSVGSPTKTATGTSTTSVTTLDSGSDVTESSPPSSPTLSRSPTKHIRKHKKQHVFHHNRYNLYDGKKIRSALIHKKWPPKPRRVSFPTSDNDLVTGYLEPANPWEHAENVNVEDLIATYKKSCDRHCTEPLQSVLSQLEKLDLSEDERCPELCMKDEFLSRHSCEPLEEILKRVQFEKMDLEGTSLDDESAVILFDMLEYYQSARHLNMSNNRNIGSRGWTACAHMIKKTTCLEQLEARDITLTQQHMNILKRSLQLVTHLHILKLENCGLAGRAFAMLVSAIKMNTGLKELYLADNGLEQEDAIQLGALLRVNNHLQLLDISNNHIKDEGARDLLDGLITQSSEDRRGRGLSILILWNNDLTKSSSTYFAQAIAQSITLETLNIGKNSVSNELLEWSEEALVKSNTLLQLGMQSTNLTCKGALVLAEILEKNRTLQRIDLRDNNIQMEGLTALSFAMKRNTSITQMDLDDKPWSTTPATMHQYLDLVSEIRGYCVRNDEPTSTDESTEESSSPQHRSRLSSVSSRKISLTCQTLPRSPPTMTPTSNEIANRAMLEPKRTSGRLRSPAPSPIPSPVASPIPSPSRGRFVVSRVSEASLSSTNSSASSSPVTPPSLASSPTCFFPSVTVGSSRFRVVTVTESSVPPAKSVVTSTNANVTIGFNYRVQTPDGNDSDDSDSVFRSDIDDDHRESSASIDIDVSFEEERKKRIKIENEETAVKISKDKNPKVEDNQTDCVVNDDIQRSENGGTDESMPETCENNFTNETQALETEELKKIDLIETKVQTEMKNDESRRDEIITSFQTEPKKIETVPRQASSLEKLLGLFQNPGTFFSGTSFEKPETKNPLQDGVNSVIALGDKFQQFLRESRGSGKTEDSPNHAPLQRSVSDASRSMIKIDPVKSLSIPQLSSIQATSTRDFANFKEGMNIFTDNSTINVQAESTRKIFVVEESPPDSGAIIEKDEISRISDDLPLPESSQSTDETIVKYDETMKIETDRKDISIVDNVNNTASNVVGESKTTICAPKLKDIPEYSVLEIRESHAETIDESSSFNKFHNKNDVDSTETICDRSTTDSINDPSFKNSSLCNITCDISGVDDVHTLENTDDVHNFLNTPLSHHCETRHETNNQSEIISCDFNEDMESKDLEEFKEHQENHGDSVEKNNENPPEQTRAIVANNLDLSLPVFNNSSLNNPIDEKNMDAQGNTVPGTKFHDDQSMLAQNIEFDDTVEEFLPIDANPTNIVDSAPLLREIDLPVLTSNCINNNNSYAEESAVANKRELDCESKVNDDVKSVNEQKIPNVEQPEIAKIVKIDESVTVSNANCLNNDFSLNDLVAAAVDQVSTSLSEDSDYSSKLSVDDARIGETSQLNSPANDRNEEIVENTEHRSFVRVAVESVLTSILSVTESTRVNNSTIKNSESVEDLMFKMTDITTDVSPIVTTIEECANPTSLIDDHLDPGQSSRSPTNLFIDKSEKIHRNSQDSGIEETTVSISEESGIEGNGQPKESFQESVDSGIDSECSSVCARVDVGADVQKERARDPGKVSSVVDLPVEIREFSVNRVVAKEEILANNEISRIVNEPIYKSEEKKNSALLVESNVVVHSTSPE